MCFKSNMLCQIMLCQQHLGAITGVKRFSADVAVHCLQYALERLKVMCEEALCTNLSVDNVSEVLVLADLHTAEQLKTYAIDFINRYAASVSSTGTLSHQQVRRLSVSSTGALSVSSTGT